MSAPPYFEDLQVGARFEHAPALTLTEGHAAQHQALVLAGSGQLTHGDFATRMARYGVRGQAAENLSGGTYTVADTVALWIRSPGHNANLLLPGVQRIGLGRSSWSFGSSWALILSR